MAATFITPAMSRANNIPYIAEKKTLLMGQRKFCLTKIHLQKAKPSVGLVHFRSALTETSWLIRLTRMVPKIAYCTSKIWSPEKTFPKPSQIPGGLFMPTAAWNGHLTAKPSSTWHWTQPRGHSSCTATPWAQI